MAYTPEEIAQLDRSKPLRVIDHKSLNESQCFLCAGPIGHGDWKATLPSLPNRSQPGPRRYAHTQCAGDAGFTIQ
jgi:hypothetical protein